VALIQGCLTEALHAFFIAAEVHSQLRAAASPTESPASWQPVHEALTALASAAAPLLLGDPLCVERRLCAAAAAPLLPACPLSIRLVLAAMLRAAWAQQPPASTSCSAIGLLQRDYIAAAVAAVVGERASEAKEEAAGRPWRSGPAALLVGACMSLLDETPADEGYAPATHSQLTGLLAHRRKLGWAEALDDVQNWIALLPSSPAPDLSPDATSALFSPSSASTARAELEALIVLMRWQSHASEHCGSNPFVELLATPLHTAAGRSGVSSNAPVNTPADPVRAHLATQPPCSPLASTVWHVILLLRVLYAAAVPAATPANSAPDAKSLPLNLTRCAGRCLAEALHWVGTTDREASASLQPGSVNTAAGATEVSVSVPPRLVPAAPASSLHLAVDLRALFAIFVDEVRQSPRCSGGGCGSPGDAFLRHCGRYLDAVAPLMEAAKQEGRYLSTAQVDVLPAGWRSLALLGIVDGFLRWACLATSNEKAHATALFDDSVGAVVSSGPSELCIDDGDREGVGEDSSCGRGGGCDNMLFRCSSCEATFPLTLLDSRLAQLARASSGAVDVSNAGLPASDRLDVLHWACRLCFTGAMTSTPEKSCSDEAASTKSETATAEVEADELAGWHGALGMVCPTATEQLVRWVQAQLVVVCPVPCDACDAYKTFVLVAAFFGDVLAAAVADVVCWEWCVSSWRRCMPGSACRMGCGWSWALIFFFARSSGRWIVRHCPPPSWLVTIAWWPLPRRRYSDCVLRVPCCCAGSVPTRKSVRAVCRH